MDASGVTNAKTGATNASDRAGVSHHRVTSDLDAFEVAQSGALCTANISRPLTITPIKFNELSASMLRVDE
jgi:hypothetical protein